MISIDEMHEILNELTDELPEEFFKDLTGGISLTEEVKFSPAAQNNDLYILAQYNRGLMGSYITFYYGSFMRAYGHLSKEDITHELRRVLRHEFRHHVEHLAGNYDLEVEDQEFIDEYLEKNKKANEA